MMRRGLSLWIVLVLSTAFVLVGCASSPCPVSSGPRVFVHPGGLNNKHDLDFVKARIAAGDQPWAGQFEEMKMLAEPTPNEAAPFEDEAQKADGLRAYANALAWYYTGDEKYAKNATGVLNLWANTFEGYFIPEGQSLLQGGWIGALLGPAAEIMRLYDGWSADEQTKAKEMFVNAFYPVLNVRSGWNGNVDLTQIDAMLNIAVFCEDEEEFNLGLQRLRERSPDYFYLRSDPARTDTAFWFAPKKWVDGLTQETVRDNGHHAQFGMGSALHGAEVAWNQGVDIYGENAKRYTAAMELLAKQLLTGSMQGVAENDQATRNLFATWEVGYNHYHNRRSLALPNTAALLARVRTVGQPSWNLFYESLTHNLDGNAPAKGN